MTELYTPALWDKTGATSAKHLIVTRYLDAWFSIMGRAEPRLVVIDGFAGPGRYEGGEPGSPIHMVKSFLRCSAADAFRAEVTFVFIERHRGRFAELKRQIAPFENASSKARFLLFNGTYADVMDSLVAELDATGASLAPAFALIDPFGYGETRFDLTDRILSFRKCEVLLYVPLVHVARFIAASSRPEGALDALFDGPAWRAIAKTGDWKRRQEALHDLFRDRLARECDYVRSFEIRGATRNTGYHLFFGTNHRLGLEKMKDAMWQADPAGGQVFSDTTHRDQEALFSPEPDYTLLERLLREHFGTEPFTIEEAEQFTLFETPFRRRLHLKKGALAPAEAAGKITVESAERRRRGTFPEGTVLRFID